MLVFGRRSREKVLSGIFSCINSNDQTQSRTMETQQEYYYTYYSYEEWGRGYIGSRGCKCLPEEDVKYFGSFYDKTFKPTQKIILKNNYTTRVEAIGDEIILHDYYDVANNPHFANQAKQTSTKFISNGEDVAKRNRAKMGEKNPMYGRKRPDTSERNRENRGRKVKYSENGLKSIKKSINLVNSQRWMCIETGYITTSGPLTIYQRNRGIDTSKRKRIV